MNTPALRHMLYHVYPGGNWRWNVHKLLRHIDVFNGVRSVAIATDGDPDIVKLEFKDTRIDNWIVLPNSPTLREVVTFPPLLETVKDLPGITWYGHTKGTSREITKYPTVMTWTKLCYESTLGRMEAVDEALQSFCVAGPFRRKLTMGRSSWHFSGTFFWFKNEVVFTKPHYYKLYPAKAGTSQIAVEAWPGSLFKYNESYCLFMDNCRNLYGADYMRNVVIPAWVRYLRGERVDDTPAHLGDRDSRIARRQVRGVSPVRGRVPNRGGNR